MQGKPAGLIVMGIAVVLWSSDLAAATTVDEAADASRCTVGALNLTGKEVSVEVLRDQVKERCDFLEDRPVRKRFAGASSRNTSRSRKADSDLLARLKAGIHDFYYEDAQQALETLEEPFSTIELRATESSVSFELAAAGWDSGVVMVRALQRTGETERAARQAARLVRIFPTGRPESRKVPPRARRLIKRQRQQLEKSGAKLRIEVISPVGECEPTVSGLSARLTQEVAVAAGRSYRVGAKCGDRIGPAVDVSVNTKEKEAIRVLGPLPSEDVTIDPDEETSRWQEYFNAVAARSDIDRLVVFFRTSQGEIGLVAVGANESTLVNETDGSASDFREVLGSEWATSGVKPPPTATTDTRSAAGDWALVAGGGALGLGAGIYSLTVLVPRGRQLACSPNNTEAKDGSACDSVERVEFQDQQAFDRAVGDFRLARGLTIGAAVAGAGLASWGIWRIASTNRQAKEAQFGIGIEAGAGWTGLRVTGGF